MSSNEETRVPYGELYKDAFTNAFETADIYAVWLQPVFKGWGRMHLEIAAAQSRAARAALDWSHAMSGARMPTDVLAANVDFYNNFFATWTAAMPKVSMALTQASAPVTVTQLPQRKRHDSIDLQDHSAHDQSSEPMRRVA